MSINPNYETDLGKELAKLLSAHNYQEGHPYIGGINLNENDVSMEIVVDYNSLGKLISEAWEELVDA